MFTCVFSHCFHVVEYFSSNPHYCELGFSISLAVHLLSSFSGENLSYQHKTRQQIGVADSVC